MFQDPLFSPLDHFLPFLTPETCFFLELCKHQICQIFILDDYQIIFCPFLTPETWFSYLFTLFSPVKFGSPVKETRRLMAHFRLVMQGCQPLRFCRNDYGISTQNTRVAAILQFSIIIWLENVKKTSN